MEEIVIIVAGGSGTRFGGPVPKQFMELKGRPVLMHTIEAFAGAGRRIVVVLPEAVIDLWVELCHQHPFAVDHRVVTGGDTRWQSVKNALTCLGEVNDDAVIAVHDGVRPLASRDLIERAFDTARRCGSAIPVIPLTDTVRQLQPAGSSITLDRATLRAVQTPQAFAARDLIDAYDVPFQPIFTDDASVMEHAGHTMTLIDGETTNIKITHRLDLMVAEHLMDNNE